MLRSVHSRSTPTCNSQAAIDELLFDQGPVVDHLAGIEDGRPASLAHRWEQDRHLASSNFSIVLLGRQPRHGAQESLEVVVLRKVG
jgi:hypothetical protein